MLEIVLHLSSSTFMKHIISSLYLPRLIEDDLDRTVDFGERQLFRKCVRDLMAPLRDLSPLLLQACMEHIAAGQTVSRAAR